MRKRLIAVAAIVALALLPGSAEAGPADDASSTPVAEGCGGHAEASDTLLD